MHRHPLVRALPLLALLVVALAPAARGGDEPGATRVDLAPRTRRTWTLALPAERWRPVGSALELGPQGTFATRLEGEALAVDTDGDGAPDVTVDGPSGHVVLTGAAGGRYGVRLLRDGAGWRWAPGGEVRGTLEGEVVRVVDQDGNGRFDDVGSDAMVVGTGDVACFLSRVASIGGRLWTLEVAPDGTALTARPWEGPAGTLDLASGLETRGRLLAAVVRSEDGSLSFEMADHPDGLRVPAGRYLLHGAVVGLGDAVVAARAGRATPIEVAPGGTTALAWGGPLHAEFEVARAAGEITFLPDHLWFHGRAGEEWYGFRPFGASPEFRVLDRGTRDEIAKAIFTGC